MAGGSGCGGEDGATNESENGNGAAPTSSSLAIMVNPPMDQNPSKSPPPASTGSSKNNKEVPVMGVGRSSRSAEQEALQQQALHQAALHQQALKQHGIIHPPLGFHSLLLSHTKQNSSEPLDNSRRGAEVIDIDEHDQSHFNAPQPQSEVEGDEEPSHSGATAPQQEECSRSTHEENRKKKNFVKVKNTVKGIGEENKRLCKPGKARQKLKGDIILESGHDTDADQQCLGVSAACEEKIKSLKVALVCVARKMQKNAHAHFVLGLMYQRLGQPMKAVAAFEKSTEILRQSEEETGQSRLHLLSLVQIHHAQCLLQGFAGDYFNSNKDLHEDEIKDIICKLKESVQGDDQHASVWNTLGLLLLRTGHVKSAISILSALLSIVPDYMDALANLGVAYIHSGELECAARCFQALLGKDKNHPGALLNYGALLLRQYGSIVAGAGARGTKGAYSSQLAAASAAQKCLLGAVKADNKAGYIWVNLASAYSLAGDHMSAGKCLEQASKLEPDRMSIRYAIAVHRVKDAERSRDPTQQLSWAANEMASILREGDPATVQPCLAWAGLAMVEKAQHETAAAFEGETDLKEVEERAFYTLQQAIEEDPDDSVQWHQLGLHTLCTLKFKEAESYLKTTIGLRKDCSFAWSNLGVTLQLSEDPSLAEDVYKQALSLAASQQTHGVLSNLGNLYRQQKRFSDALQAFSKALEICPSYAPACNNLGLLYIADCQWQKAISCFDQALISDPLLDAAKSNKMKAVALSSSCCMNGGSDSPISPAILNSPETPLDLPPSLEVLLPKTLD